jgi:5'-phosphate synthase pdxT subunit
LIRAPIIEELGPDVQVLATLDGRPIAVRQGHCLATTFHPELTPDPRFHRYFVKMLSEAVIADSSGEDTSV